jgi:hypothetical protein
MSAAPTSASPLLRTKMTGAQPRMKDAHHDNPHDLRHLGQLAQFEKNVLDRLFGIAFPPCNSLI